MKKQINPSIKAHLLRSAFILLSLLAICAIQFALAQRNSTKPSGSASTSQLPASQLPRASREPSGTNTITSPAASKLPGVVLYDQLNNPGATGTLSQEFPNLPSSNAFTADDFVVPSDQMWTITEVDAKGVYLNGTGPADNFNVFFYADNAGLPGTQIHAATAQTYVNNAGVFQVTLSIPVILTAGTYWVSVQAHMSSTPNGSWEWADRAAQGNRGAAWQNPGGGFGVGSTWGRRTTWVGDESLPDQMFRLIGTPAGCIPSYTLALGGSTFVPAVTDVGNHCDNCSTPIILPFPVTLYDHTFTTASAGSNGHLTFGTSYDGSNITCSPFGNTLATYVMAPYWADQCTGTCGTTTCDGCGIFTTTTGSAPNRIFYVEFRTQYFNQTTDLLDYEIALYENGTPPFRFIYSHIVRAPAANDSQLVVGVRRDDTHFTQFICDPTGGRRTPGNILHPCRGAKCRAVTASLVPCATPTPTPTATATGTPTATPTASPTPTPTPTASPTPTPTATATPCDSGIIQNGGFETGSFPPWVILDQNATPVVTNTQAHSGTFSGFVGDAPDGFCGFMNNEANGDSSFYQQFTVPAGGGTLSFWHWDCTTDTIDFDWQDAYITDTNGNILQTIFHQCLDTEAWVNQTVDMTPYAGQTVRIEFLAHEDGFGDLTGMFVDDVQLLEPCGTPTPTASPSATATPTASPTPTPTPTASPTATPTGTPTVTPTPSTTPRVTPTPRLAPSPRSRPTPPPRPGAA